jgi:MFS transporter, DHA1 family, tetracycline resistance protein
MPPEKSPPGLTALVICSALLVMGFMLFNTIIGPIARAAGLAEWQVGLILTMAGLVWMACSTPWGTLSDRRGRKTVLVWSLLGFAVSFALLTLAVWGSVRHVWSAGVAFAVLLVAPVVLGLLLAAAAWAVAKAKLPQGAPAAALSTPPS